jgi:putative PIN family toxin of toxin-antitoxin system
MRIVVDTNIVASAIFFGGLPRKLIDLLLDDVITAVVSNTIFAEYKGTIDRLSKKYPERPISIPLGTLMSHFEFIEPVSQLKICRDPDDDKFISCANDGDCLFIVSGDNDLLVLQEYADIQIMTVRDFLERYYVI